MWRRATSRPNPPKSPAESQQVLLARPAHAICSRNNARAFTVAGLNIDRELRIQQQAQKYGSTQKAASELERHVATVARKPKPEESELSAKLKAQQQKEADAEKKSKQPVSELEAAMAKRKGPSV
eukprot:m.395526 g.395526  ORF g.395526 m.395526 type:complete len:125 (+) comp56394_c0_seq10:131-505(+)